MFSSGLFFCVGLLVIIICWFRWVWFMVFWIWFFDIECWVRCFVVKNAVMFFEIVGIKRYIFYIYVFNSFIDVNVKLVVMYFWNCCYMNKLYDLSFWGGWYEGFWEGSLLLYIGLLCIEINCFCDIIGFLFRLLGFCCFRCCKRLYFLA